MVMASLKNGPVIGKIPLQDFRWSIYEDFSSASDAGRAMPLMGACLQNNHERGEPCQLRDC